MVEGLCAHRGKRFRAQKQVRSRVSAYYVWCDRV